MVDSSTLGWVIPLFCTGLVGAVVWIVKLAIELNSMSKDIQSLSKDLETAKETIRTHMAHNAGQHEELFLSRNQTDQTLVLLKTLFENMDKKLDQLLDRRPGSRI